MNNLIIKSSEMIPSMYDADKIKPIIEKQNSYFEIQETDVNKELGQIGIEVYNSYLPVISEIYEPVSNCSDFFNPEAGIVYFDITKWVSDPEEKSIDKLVNVYQTLSDQDSNIALIYDRVADKCSVTLAVANMDSTSKYLTMEWGKRISGALRGNFPGVEIKHSSDNPWTNYGIPKSLAYESKSVALATISSIPSEKSEDYVSQSMEKILDGIIPSGNDRYTLILLASPNHSLEKEKLRLYNLYSNLSKDSEFQTNQNTTFSFGMSDSTTAGVTTGTALNANAIFIGATKNFGLNFSKTVGVNTSTTKSTGITRTYTNYGIKHTLENIEAQIKRLEECSALGFWDFSAYVISNSPTLTRNVAYSYLSLIQGEESYLGEGSVNFWNWNEKEEVNIILESLSRLRHPSFVLSDDAIDMEKNWLMYPAVVNSTMSISGKELAYALNFPRKSVAGLPVLESASFGREVQHYELIPHKSKVITIGKIVHMRKQEDKNVDIDLNSLTAHSFVTGSTGAGKTNAILQILKKANKNGVKFLVIEPAKGEYKNEIGGICKVYGTNPRLFELLRINPFSFPENITVLEHIDRLVEILNACWPMYAAMPAVLKDAVERAYRKKGWNLDSVFNNSCSFPTFFDLLETLPEVLDESEYSADTKGDYIGALVTRIKSMTNGLNGKILCADEEILPTELFDENVIVDLSRVSSTETKALIMGVLIMKLQEYKINQEDNAFSTELKHLTVLEEAHNLLRRTNGLQSQDSANLQGKSVEMITNAIAEMRAYGEGFVIVDQAPGLLDEAVIRNTNTKISLRLPDISDRELVGKAAALKDTQIEEIAKLPKGVAVVYQNDWVEAVLCQFEEYTDKTTMKTHIYEEDQNSINPADLFFAKVFPACESNELSKEETDAIKNWIEKIHYSDYTKRKLREALISNVIDENSAKEIAYNLFEGKNFAKILMDAYDNEEGIDKARAYVGRKYNLSDRCNIPLICDCIYQKVCEENTNGVIERRYNLINGGMKW